MIIKHEKNNISMLGSSHVERLYQTFRFVPCSRHLNLFFKTRLTKITHIQTSEKNVSKY